MSANVGVDSCKVAEKLLRCLVILEEVEALALSALDSQALDVVEDQAGQVVVRSSKLSLSFLTLKLEFIDCVLEDSDGSIDIIFQHQGAAEKIVGFQ